MKIKLKVNNLFILIFLILISCKNLKEQEEEIDKTINNIRPNNICRYDYNYNEECILNLRINGLEEHELNHIDELFLINDKFKKCLKCPQDSIVNLLFSKNISYFKSKDNILKVIFKSYFPEVKIIPKHNENNFFIVKNDSIINQNYLDKIFTNELLYHCRQNRYFNNSIKDISDLKILYHIYYQLLNKVDNNSIIIVDLTNYTNRCRPNITFYQFNFKHNNFTKKILNPGILMPKFVM